MKVNHSGLLIGALVVLFVVTAAWGAGLDSFTLALDKHTLSVATASSTQESARQALRAWLDCFVNADGGAFYDMMPSSAKTKFDHWFDKLSASPSWKADPESAKVPTSRSFLVLAFEEAKNQGGLGMDVKDSDFESGRRNLPAKR